MENTKRTVEEIKVEQEVKAEKTNKINKINKKIKELVAQEEEVINNEELVDENGKPLVGISIADKKVRDNITSCLEKYIDIFETEDNEALLLWSEDDDEFAKIVLSQILKIENIAIKSHNNTILNIDEYEDIFSVSVNMRDVESIKDAENIFYSNLNIATETEFIENVIVTSYNGYRLYIYRATEDELELLNKAFKATITAKKVGKVARSCTRKAKIGVKMATRNLPGIAEDTASIGADILGKTGEALAIGGLTFFSEFKKTINSGNIMGCKAARGLFGAKKGQGKNGGKL